MIRVGIVSQYFWKHSVWDALLKGWILQLDRSRISIHAFYLGTRHDEETVLAKAHAAYFRQGPLDLRQWVEAVMDEQLDVIIYPEVGMDPLTAQLAALRLAPVQVATWGHPETTGLATIDYYLSAELFEPPNAQEHYTEQLILLPHLGSSYTRASIAPIVPDLQSLGIDARAVLLVCPGVPFKYAPAYDRVLAEIASKLGRCQLIFFTHRLSHLSDKLRQRIAIAFGLSGLAADDFVTFIPWQDTARFFGLLERADVFLDTIGFSGFNTAMQAVECGIPIVTRESAFLRGRLASGILKRLGLSELIAQSEAEYVAVAVQLAQDATYRSHIRQRIAQSRQVLFDDAAPIRAMEAFFSEVVLRC
jgi:protein O-GlcNAc transferase